MTPAPEQSRRTALPKRRCFQSVMRRLLRISLILAIAASDPAAGSARENLASWLDEAKPASWNTPGQPVPAAPSVQGNIDPRCREQVRPPQLQEDALVYDRGWDLIGAYQGGWQLVVLSGTAGYDGMCRPLQYQDFVFARGVFTGTLSPQAMDSRADGALGRVYLQSESRLTAEYARYGATDPACCPSSTTAVQFEITRDGFLRPLSASTSSNQ